MIEKQIKANDIQLFERAFIHKSYATELGLSDNNERLEFLGDALLTSIISEYLYAHNGSLSEGQMTKVRSAYIKRTSLNRLATTLKLTEFIRATGNAASSSNSLPGNVLEAFIGALYLDQGYEALHSFVQHHILSRLAPIEEVLANDKNYKSRLLEWGQKEQASISWETNKVNSENGFLFEVVVSLEGKEVGKSTGSSKKKAEQKAAQQVCIELDI